MDKYKNTDRFHDTIILYNYTCPYRIRKGKGKTVLLQAQSGPEDSRKLLFLHFMTTAQEGCKVVSFTHRPHLHPGNPVLLDDESTPGP
jgi:hypothetical protein